MPKGPKGEKRPADVIGTAVKVAKIATGEIEDKQLDDGKNKAAQELGRKGGQATYLNVLCRAPEPHHENVHAPVHEADQRIL